jgi:predicted GIY-YIG superfamily endonuclease
LNYVGYTVDYNHRLRQHCGILKGGAFYTKNRGPWEFLAVIHCSSWNNIRALQVEWLIKHPTRKRKKPKYSSSSEGRIKSLVEFFDRIPLEEGINIYIHPEFQKLTETLNLPNNIKIEKFYMIYDY